MGPAAVAIVVVTAWLGWLIWRNPVPHRRPGLVLGAALGLMLGSAATLVITAPLAAGAINGPGHWVGGLRSDAGGWPLFGWSTTGGDLRVPHFFATHLMQALPLAGSLADWIAPRRSRTLVWAAAVLGVLVTALTLAQAVAGRPFLASLRFELVGRASSSTQAAVQPAGLDLFSFTPHASPYGKPSR